MRVCREVPRLAHGCHVQNACVSFTVKDLASAALAPHWRDTTIMLHEVPYGSVMATLWACCSCYSCCVSQAVKAAGPTNREQGCLQFLRLLKPPSSILGWVLPDLGSANTVGSMNSKVTGIMKRGSAMQWCGVWRIFKANEVAKSCVGSSPCMLSTYWASQSLLVKLVILFSDFLMRLNNIAYVKTLNILHLHSRYLPYVTSVIKKNG